MRVRQTFPCSGEGSLFVFENGFPSCGRNVKFDQTEYNCFRNFFQQRSNEPKSSY